MIFLELEKKVDNLAQMKTFDELRDENNGVLISTKQVAQAMGISTPKAYRILCAAEDAGEIGCYGYRDKEGGTYGQRGDTQYANKKSSLVWNIGRN